MNNNNVSDQSYRRIYFIHGLGGNGSAWTKVAEACWNKELDIEEFPARKCLISKPDYTNETNGSLGGAADYVRQEIIATSLDDISAYNMNPSDAILIAHSQGGVLCRSMFHYDFNNSVPIFGRPYGGFVSVSSPLQGAMILNNRNDIILMADDACKSLLKGPLSTSGYNWILKLLFGREYQEDLCSLISNDILPVFFDDYYDDVTNDYLVGSETITIWNSDISNSDYCNMSKVAFYGVEPENNLFWRTANWLVNNPNDEVYFQANDDFKFYNETIFPMYLNYYGKYKHYQNKLNNLNNWSWLICATDIGFLIYLTLKDSWTNKMNSWGAGVNWFDNANTEWETIIGARTQIATTTTHYRCRNCTFQTLEYILGFIPSPTVELCEIFGCQSIQPINVTTYSWEYKENDGVVVDESAANLPCSTSPPVRIFPFEFENVISKGSSHMQIRNDEGIKRALKALFDGEYGWFFLTEGKE